MFLKGVLKHNKRKDIAKMTKRDYQLPEKKLIHEYSGKSCWFQEEY